MNGYIYDFLSIFFDKLENKELIKSVILFGSFARGNQGEDSDIDIFVDVDEPSIGELSRLTKEAVNEFELKATKKWHLRGIKNAINLIVDDLSKEQWKELRSEISKYGIVLYGNFFDLEPNKEKHAALIEYDISKLKQNKKMTFIRKLYGYNLKKNKKVYTIGGMATRLKGEKITSAILVDFKDLKSFLSIIKSEGISLKIREIWMK